MQCCTVHACFLRTSSQVCHVSVFALNRSEMWHGSIVAVASFGTITFAFALRSSLVGFGFPVLCLAQHVPVLQHLPPLWLGLSLLALVALWWMGEDQEVSLRVNREVISVRGTWRRR